MSSSPVFLLLLVFLISSTHAILLPHAVRATSTSDLIGFYTIHPETDVAARPNFCPRNLTTDTFEFQVTRAPAYLAVPELFNVQIDHRNTLINDRRCESTSTIVATSSSHPFAKSNLTEVITTWAAAGRNRPARWLSDDFLAFIAEEPFVVGYDFFERTCRGSSLRPGVGFLWFQPPKDVSVSGLTLTSRNKYLLLTFSNDPWSGCIFVADAVGGQGEFPSGPVADPSLTEDIEPETLSEENNRPAPTILPTSTADKDDPKDDPKDDLEETTSPDVVDDVDDVDDDDSTDEEPSEDTSDTDDSDDDEPSEGVNEIFSDVEGDEDLEEPACFPASARVQLEDGRMLQLSDLQIGHKVRTAPSQYSDVFFFSHRQIARDSLYDFIKIVISDTHWITLSPGHYLYANHKLAPARRVRIGDTLYAADGEEVTVRSVERVKEQGLVAPHTLHGDVIVNNVRTSTYTAAVHPHLAHYVLLAPLRALYHLGFSGVFGDVLHSGSDQLRRMVPRGPDQLNRFL